MCGFCKPGYKKTVHDNHEFYVKECIAINNCGSSTDKGNWVNACSLCSTWKYNENTEQILFDECVTQVGDNCLAYNSATSECQFC